MVSKIKEQTNVGGTYNHTEKLSSYLKAPQIKWVDADSCDSKGICKEGNEGITINSSYNKDVILYTQPAKVDLKFYAYADRNQMPLTEIKIDWGDGFQTVRRGSFRNKRGGFDGQCVNAICVFNDKYWEKSSSPLTTTVTTNRSCVNNLDCKNLDYCQSEDKATNFGQIIDTTCDNDYYLFTYVYQCDQNSGKNYMPSGSSECPTTLQKDGCCIFKPKVQVKDNWGWCNGQCARYQKIDPAFGESCPCDKNKLSQEDYNKCVVTNKCVNVNEVSAGGVGCYDGEWKKKAGLSQCSGANWSFKCNNECNIFKDSAWTTTTVKVIVAPR